MCIPATVDVEIDSELGSDYEWVEDGQDIVKVLS